MNPRFTLTLLIASLVYSAGFSQTNPVLKYLPEKAATIISFHPQRLYSKIPGDAFKQSYLFKQMAKEKGKNSPVNFLSDLSRAGIDFGSDAFVCMVTDTTPGFYFSMHLLARLNQPDIFASWIKNKLPEDPILTYGTNHMIINDHFSLAWNSEVAIFSAGDDNRLDVSEEVMIDTLPVDMEKMKKDMEVYREKNQKARREKNFELLTPKPNGFFNTNNRFLQLASMPGDFKTWSNGSSSLFGNAKMFPMGGLFQMRSLLGGTKAAVMNFENGKVVAQNFTYPDESFAAIYKKYQSGPQQTELLQKLPPGKLLLLMNASYNGEMGKELMKTGGMQSFLDSLKELLPFLNAEQPSTAFKNNFMLAVIKADQIDPADSLTQKLGGLQVFLAAPIADKASFEQVKTMIRNCWDSLQEQEGFAKTFKNFKPALRYNDELFVLSVSPQSAETFLNQKPSGTIPKWLEPYTQHPMVIRLDMRELLTMAFSKISGAKSGGAEQTMLGMFSDFVVYGGEFKDGSLNTTTEFRFSDPDKNSLFQFFTMMNLMAEEQEKKKAEFREMDDELKIVPPPPPPKQAPPKVEMKKFTPPVIKKEEEKQKTPPASTKPKAKTKG